jgi:hypothetical protein
MAPEPAVCHKEGLYTFQETFHKHAHTIKLNYQIVNYKLGKRLHHIRRTPCPVLSSEHLQLHQQKATQAQCQDGRHPTKQTSYCL